MALPDPIDQPTIEEQLTDELVTLISQVGGLPRIAARIFTALLTSDEPFLSGPELAARLEISSGSLSTMTRLLEGQGMIERFSRPKVRADLFRIDADHWQATLRRAADISRRYKEISARLEQTVDSESARQRLGMFSRLNGYLADTLSGALESGALENWRSGE